MISVPMWWFIVSIYLSFFGAIFHLTFIAIVVSLLFAKLVDWLDFVSSEKELKRRNRDEN